MRLILTGLVSITGSSPIENESQTESEASLKQIANMKEQIENYRAIISKQEQLLQVCVLGLILCQHTLKKEYGVWKRVSQSYSTFSLLAYGCCKF